MEDQAKKNKTRLAVALLAISAGLFLVLVASSQNESHKSITHQEIEKEARPPKVYTVGNINGVPVKMPSGMQDSSGIRQYDDTPGPFSREWKDYKAPAVRTYQDNLMSFGFDFKYPKNELFDLATTSLLQVREEHNLSPDPWIHAGVHAGKSTPKISLDKYFKAHINADRGFPEDDPWGKQGNYYNKTNKTLYGLQIYEVNKDLVKRIPRIGDWDIFVHRNDNGEVIGFIECSKRDVRNPPCNHKFILFGFNGARGTLHYSRHHLEHWQEIQQMAENHLRSWIVETEKNSVVLK